MSNFSVTEPSNRSKWIAGFLVITYALITMIPLVWILLTGFKSPADAISYLSRFDNISDWLVEGLLFTLRELPKRPVFASTDEASR